MNLDGTVEVPAFELRFSTLASRESREAAVRQHLAEQRWRASVRESPPADTEELRNRVDDAFFQPLLDKQRLRWGDQVESSIADINGVRVDAFTPKAGVAAANGARVLINLHGGGFEVGSRTLAEVESLPIAGLGQIRVLSVDYRMFPEHRFPAASEDVAAVYEALLRDHKPQSIGIYGSSAGGILTAQSIAWFIEHHLPLPGAVGMFAGTGEYFGGDSVALAAHLYNAIGESAQGAADVPPVETPMDVGMPYFEGAELTGRLVAPMLHPDLLKRFPRSLLITASRAAEMSAVVDAHNRLVLAGAQSRLHVWDGLGHCFYLDADLPESHEAERIIVEFFGEALE